MKPFFDYEFLIMSSLTLKARYVSIAADTKMIGKVGGPFFARGGGFLN
jgi:hypothetical protein